MTTTCPNCGKPLRPGSKFCGNCGTTIAAVAPPKAAAPSDREYSTVQPAANACPHCGKPLRPGAKFCNSCGKSVPEGVLLPAVGPQVARPAAPPVGVPSTPPSQGPVAVPAPAVSERKPARKRVWVGLLLGILSIVCVVVLAAAYAYRKDPFGWFRRPTNTPIASEVLPTEEVSETLKPSDTPVTTLTTISTDTISPPEAITPSVAYPSSEATLPAVVPTATTAVATTAVPMSALQGRTLFEDKFDSDINVYWIPWGRPKFWPSIKRGPEGGWLNLMAYEGPGLAGVSSKMEIPSSAEVEVAFEAQLNPNYPQYPLIFDWDSLDDPRNEESQNPGVVHIEINTEKLILKTPFNQQSTCIRPINGAGRYEYHVRFTDNQGVLVFIDGSPVEPCSIPNIGRQPMPGRISFTGMGWVMYVRVTAP